jgi:hypothetical protein
VLKITPPFFYSYQCGSTLLTSYIPVHMYSISLQVLFTIVTLVIAFSSDWAQHPSWLLSLFPGVCWPSHWQKVGGSIDLQKKPVRLISPHQIISRTMSNIILLLSFGLCSPVLCVFIAVSICVHLLSWLVLIGRFVSVRLDALHASGESPPSTELDEGSIVSLSSLPIVRLISSPPLFLAEAPNDSDLKTIIADPLLHLLDQQLQGVHSSLLVCKWPVTLMSCFFVTLLCWDMAGDKGGWSQALWVPIVGVAMVLLIWVWDHLMKTRAADGAWRYVSYLFSSSSSHHSSDHHPSASSICQDTAHSLQLVRPSLHQPRDTILGQGGEESVSNPLTAVDSTRQVVN